MYSALLSLHIIGALFSAVLATFAVLVALTGRDGWYKTLSLGIGVLAAFEVSTGTVLAVLSPEVSALSICANVALYIAAAASIQALLFMRMRRITLPFPAFRALSPLGASMVLLATSVVFGF